MQTPKHRRITHPKNSVFKNPKAVLQQHMKDSTDINEIVARARRGIAPTNTRERGNFVDISNVPQDLTEAFNTVDRAWDSFMTLPARAREELGNDPRRLLQANADFFKRHGILHDKVDAPLGAKPAAESRVDQGSGGGRPPKKAAKAATPDLEDQE